MSQSIPLIPSEVYHIYTHANGNENLFRENENYRYFLEKYLYHVYPVVETFAYCLMPNHLHLMIRIRNEEVLKEYFITKGKNLQGFQNLGGLISQQFSNLFNAYTKAYNKKYDRIGSLFQPKFRRKPVENDAYFTASIAYIHNNPIHHGFVSDINDWPHSSWHSYLLVKPTHIARDEGTAWFGNKEKFIKFHREMKKKDIMLEFE